MEVDAVKVKKLLDSGPKGALFISQLSKQSKFANALATEIGTLLLKDAVDRSEFLLSKIIDEKATEQEKAEFRALKGILDRWADRVDVYLKNLEKVAKGVR